MSACVIQDIGANQSGKYTRRHQILDWKCKQATLRNGPTRFRTHRPPDNSSSGLSLPPWKDTEGYLIALKPSFTIRERMLQQHVRLANEEVSLPLLSVLEWRWVHSSVDDIALLLHKFGKRVAFVTVCAILSLRSPLGRERKKERSQRGEIWRQLPSEWPMRQGKHHPLAMFYENQTIMRCLS